MFSLSFLRRRASRLWLTWLCALFAIAAQAGDALRTGTIYHIVQQTSGLALTTGSEATRNTPVTLATESAADAGQDCPITCPSAPKITADKVSSIALSLI